MHSGIFTISLLVKISIKCSLPANITFVFFLNGDAFRSCENIFFAFVEKVKLLQGNTKITQKHSLSLNNMMNKLVKIEIHVNIIF